MKLSKVIGVAAAIAISAITAGSVQAKVWNFTFTDISGDAASGQFVTVGNGPIQHITSISGVFDGLAITGLSPYASATNNLFFPGPPNYDFGGTSFSLTNGVHYNLSNFEDPPLGAILNSTNDPVGYGTYAVALTSFNLTAVPEPATWALMLVGVGGLGASLRSRRKAALTV